MSSGSLGLLMKLVFSKRVFVLEYAFLDLRARLLNVRVEFEQMICALSILCFSCIVWECLHGTWLQDGNKEGKN